MLRRFLHEDEMHWFHSLEGMEELHQRLTAIEDRDYHRQKDYKKQLDWHCQAPSAKKWECFEKFVEIVDLFLDKFEPYSAGITLTYCDGNDVQEDRFLCLKGSRGLLFSGERTEVMFNFIICRAQQDADDAANSEPSEEFAELPTWKLWNSLRSVKCCISICNRNFPEMICAPSRSTQMECSILELVDIGETTGGFQAFPSPKSFPAVNELILQIKDTSQPDFLHNLLKGVRESSSLKSLQLWTSRDDLASLPRSSDDLVSLPRSWTSAIMKLLSITKINLDRFRVSDESFRELFKNSQESNKLKEFSLFGCDVDSSTLCEALQNFPPNIEKVYMDHVKVLMTDEEKESDAIFNSAASALKEKVLIKNFHLSIDPITEEGKVSYLNKVVSTFRSPEFHCTGVKSNIHSEIKHQLFLNRAGRRALEELPSSALPSLVSRLLEKADKAYSHDGVYYLLREYADLRTTVARCANVHTYSRALEDAVEEGIITQGQLHAIFEIRKRQKLG